MLELWRTFFIAFYSCSCNFYFLYLFMNFFIQIIYYVFLFETNFMKNLVDVYKFRNKELTLID